MNKSINFDEILELVEVGPSISVQLDQPGTRHGA